MKRRSHSDQGRRRKVEAAVRYAERVTRETDAVRPVIFSPKNPQTSPRPGAAAAADPKSSGRFRNPAMEEALRDALGLPRVSASAATVLIPAQQVQDATAPRGAKAGSRKPKKATLLRAEVRTKAKTPKPRSDAAKIPRSHARRKKPKPSPPTAARPQVKDVAKPTPEWQRRAKESIARSRRDLNARLRGATTVQATSPFLDLQRRRRMRTEKESTVSPHMLSPARSHGGGCTSAKPSILRG